MENQLSKYINKELYNVIESVKVIQGTAKDSGNVYYAIEIKLVNGYSFRVYPKEGDRFAWVNAFEYLDANTQIDKAF